MVDAGVRTLLDAVRRHLWREQARVAVRRAAWLSAATVLVAGAVHLAALSVPVGAVLWVLGLEWTALLGAVAARPPTDAECALCIDRHLGGASAFTTLLDPTSNTQTPGHAQAVRWLERWAAEKVPDVLRSLGEQRPSVQVSRSLLAAAVCSLLGLFLLTLPDTVPVAPRPARASAGAAANDPPAAAAQPAVAAQLASEIANALRSTASPSEREGHLGGDASTGAPTRADDRTGSTTTSRATLLPPDASPTLDARPSAALDASAAAGRGRSAAAVAGRDAGDSPDSRADLGVSRAPTGTIAEIRSRSTLRLAAGERRADMEQGAGFDENMSAAGGGATPAAVVAGAAATPPPAVAAARLSPAESSYVQAWMKATGRSR